MQLASASPTCFLCDLGVLVVNSSVTLVVPPVNLENSVEREKRVVSIVVHGVEKNGVVTLLALLVISPIFS